jgi:integrase
MQQSINFSEYDDNSKTKVQDFLESVGRNSKNTKITYSYSLNHFRKFLDDKYGYTLTIGNILDKINSKELDVYTIINNFITFLDNSKKITNRSIKHYVVALKSYLQFYDVEISQQKFRHRVKMPKQYHENEEPIDYEEIREILKACDNRRLKAYLYVLASGGMRANEALALRIKDVDFSESPTKVHISRDNKTKTPRDIYISDEATKELKRWLTYKYNKRRKSKRPIQDKSDNHLIFTKYFEDSIEPSTLYNKLNVAFHHVLKTANLEEIKEGSHSNRRKIVLNSFRHFVYTTIGDQQNTDYANWFIGHANSAYWGKKEEHRRELYQSKCMKALTFLDFSGLVTRSKNIETKLDTKDKEIRILAERDSTNEKAINELKKTNSKIISHLEGQRKMMAALLQNYFVLGEDKPDWVAKSTVLGHNKQVANFIRNGILDIDKGYLIDHLPDKYVEEFGLTKKGNRLK